MAPETVLFVQSHPLHEALPVDGQLPAVVRHGGFPDTSMPPTAWRSALAVK
jgi:hypothetical protein